MRRLPALLREKAIEIANALLMDGYDDGRAIRIAISQARRLASGQHAATGSDSPWSIYR